MSKIIHCLSICVLLLTFQRTNAQQWGWATLIAQSNSTSVTMLDTNSTVIKQWTGLSGNTGYSSYVMQGGDLWRTVKVSGAWGGGGITGRIQKVNWAGTILFDYTINDATQCAHHDICPLPNGNVLVIVYEVRSAAQVSAAGCTANATRWTEKVVELQPTGINTANIVWQWNLWDHLLQKVDPTKPNYYSSIVNHPELLNVNYNNVRADWVHMNGIDYNAALDQIVLSSHWLNELWVIDHSTTTAIAAGHTGGNGGKGGDFLYRWGNPLAYDAGGTSTLKVVHDAHWVPANCPNANYLVGFNNQGITNNQSCVDLVNPPYAGYNYSLTPGQAYTPPSYTIRQAANGFSSNMGNSQQLPNGNMLICLATASTVREIDANGNQLWTYSGSGSIPQASRYERCYIENPSVSAVTANPTICSEGSIQLNINSLATNVNSFTYNWSPSTGLSSATAQNPTISGISASNTYSVTVTTPGGCSTTLSIPVTVTPLPAVSAGNNVSITAGQSTTLVATGGGTYAWSNGATTASTTVTPTTTTTYSVVVTGTNGCTATDNVVVNVTNTPLTATATASEAAICAGLSTQLFGNAGGGNSPNYTYAWTSSPAGFTSSTASPSVSPTQTTTYTLLVTAGAQTATATVTVTVKPLPTANAGNDVNIALGNSTALSATGGGTYAWSNGATTASTSVTPITTTTYSVVVTGTNGCTATDNVVVNVTNTPLTATATASEAAICAGLSTQLFGTAGGGNSPNYTYAWTSNPAGFTSSTASPSVSPTQTTTYTLLVTAGAQTATATVTVTVKPLPTANAGNDVNIALGNSTALSATGGGTYAWSNGATIASTTVTPTTSTTYTVVVTGTNGCTDSDEVIVTVLNNPLNAIITATNTTICNGDVAQLMTQVGGNTGNLTYAWTSLPSGFESTNANPFINPTETTTYQLVVSDGTFFALANMQITVNALPPTPTITSNMTELMSSSSNNNQWFFYGSPIDGATNPIFVPVETGSYQVQIVDINGCFSPLSEPIFFEIANPLVVSISGTDTTICNGDVLQLFANLTGNTSTPSYTWTSIPIGFESTIGDPFINPFITTTYTLVVVDGAQSATASFTVTVKPLPTQPTIATVDDATLQSSSPTNNQWYFYGSPIDGAINQDFVPEENGSYQVQTVDENSCFSPLSEPFFFGVNVIENVQGDSQWQIFPNPAFSVIQISGLENEPWLEIKIVDQVGKIVIWQKKQSNAVAVEALPPGLYAVVLRTRNGSSVRKLEIVR